MPYAFSLPIKADKVPAGPDSLHEVKYDGLDHARAAHTAASEPTSSSAIERCGRPTVFEGAAILI
jgi:hypothetical protein